MTIRNDIPGLTQVGSTHQTIALADVLSRDPSARKVVAGLLRIFEREPLHTNDNSDRRQLAAERLADLIREYNGPELN